MTKQLIEHATNAWSGWFPGESTPSLSHAVSAGGPAHGDRAIMFLFQDAGSRPRVVLKIALSPREARFLSGEFTALANVRPLLGPEMAKSVPRPLDSWRTADLLVVACEALQGRRLLVPHLLGQRAFIGRHLVRHYLAGVFGWSRDLAQGTAVTSGHHDESELGEVVDAFVTTFRDDSSSIREARSFGRALTRASVTWRPTWQHGDPGVGNVLRHRGRIRFVDWEHAAPDHDPWFDIAYAPASIAMLARRQVGLDDLRPVLLEVLDPRGWVGGTLQREMKSSWDYSIPMPWGVAVTSMRAALRRREGERKGWRPWMEFADLILRDREVRDRIDWLAPRW